MGIIHLIGADGEIHIIYHCGHNIEPIVVSFGDTTRVVPKAQYVNCDSHMNIKDSVLDIESPLYIAPEEL